MTFGGLRSYEQARGLAPVVVRIVGIFVVDLGVTGYIRCERFLHPLSFVVCIEDVLASLVDIRIFG